MNGPKRKLSFGGMSPEQAAIVHGESSQGGTAVVESPPVAPPITKKPVEENSPAVEKSAKVTTEPEAPKEVPRAKKRSPKTSERKDYTGPLTNQTYRLPDDLVTDLMRASMDRKIRKVAPQTQQDIVAEALADWLAKNASELG